MERRLVAILAADIVGYSALMEADETDIRQRQRDIHAQVIDPQIAGGYAGASFATLLLASESYGSPEQTQAMLERARGLAQQAVDLDPAFTAAHAALTHPYQDAQEAQEFAAALVAAGLKP